MKNLVKICGLVLMMCHVVYSIPPALSKLSNLKKISVPSPTASDIKYRLPNNTIPLHYDIHLTTHIHDNNASNRFKFEGEVKIKFKVVSEPLNTITLHAKNLEIASIKLDNGTNVVSHKNDTAKDFLIITTTTNLTVDSEHTLEITYESELRDDNLGFYRSSYKDENGTTVWIATTQFESVEARSAFPCYDEPQIRTEFDIKITHGKAYHAIGNMPETKVNSPGNYATTKFKRTIKMQTYLIAFVVSNFGNVNDSTVVPIQRVFAKPQSIQNGDADVALKYGIEIIKTFNEYMGVQFPLPKLDQVALTDFDAGAMENFGLVTYREEYLLHNINTDRTQQRENVLTVVSHEYAHMWFGNLVAPEWWNYLWLNEGFATLYEYYLVSLIYENDRLMDTFLLNALQPALEEDGNDGIRPMTHYVESPEDIDDLFDTIAYEKSGSVLRMIQNAIGHDTWRRGINNYLKNFEDNFNGKVGTPSLLHAGLQKSVNDDKIEGIDIDKIMTSWETQAGYPVIFVSLSGDSLTFKQERFFYQPNVSSTSLWHVPINYVTKSDSTVISTKPDLWLKGVTSISVNRTDATRHWSNGDWVIANVQQGYYYRVNYDEQLWDLIALQLKTSYDKIDPRNRAQLLDDSLNLARAGQISYKTALSILSYLKEETDYHPWAAVYGDIFLLNRWLSGLPVHSKFQKFIRKLVEPLYNRLNSDVMENEHKFKRYARSSATMIACQFGIQACLQNTKSKLNSTENHADMILATIGNGLMDATSEQYTMIINEMLNSKVQDHRTILISALGFVQNEELLKEFLMYAIKDDSPVRLQEKSRIINSWTNGGVLGVKTAMSFVRENYKKIAEYKSSQVKSTLSAIAIRISSEELKTQFNELLDFLKNNSIIEDSHIEDYTKSVAGITAWQEKNVKDIEDWLSSSAVSTISIVVLAFSVIIKLFL